MNCVSAHDWSSFEVGVSSAVKWGPQPCPGTSHSPVPALEFVFLSHNNKNPDIYE